MSKYTSLLRYVCENKSGFTPEQIEEKTIDEIIDAAIPHIFDFNFPVHTEEFRPVLEHEILFHFYMQEIGAETYGLFHYYLARKLREIMPYYSQLYASAELEFNPLHDVDYTKSHEGTAAGNKNTTGQLAGHTSTTGETSAEGERETSGAGTLSGSHSETRVTDTTGREVADTQTESDGTTNRVGSSSFSESNVHRDAYSDTPQTSVRGVEGDGSGNNNNVSDNYYLTNYRKITDSKSGSSSVTDDTTTHNESAGNATTNKTGNETVNITGSNSENTTTTGLENTTESGTSNTVSDTATSTTGAEQFNNTDAYIEHITGKIGAASYSSMLLEFRETILNINKMVFDELEICFMQIY